VGVGGSQRVVGAAGGAGERAAGGEGVAELIGAVGEGDGGGVPDVDAHAGGGVLDDPGSNASAGGGAELGGELVISDHREVIEDRRQRGLHVGGLGGVGGGIDWIVQAVGAVVAECLVAVGDVGEAVAVVDA